MEHDDLERRLSALGQHPIPPGLASEHLTKIATAGSPSRWSSKLRVGAAFLAGLLLGGSGLAAAGALPDPVQHAAHEALGTVGVDVPDPDRYHGDECGDEVKRNHGAYVRDDHSLAKTRCGKPAGAGREGEDGPKPEKGPCQGPPPWAGKDKVDMTVEEKAAAQAKREADCPDEGAEDAEAPEARASEGEPEGEGEPTTTTTAAPTTTTTVADTTTTTGSTTTTAATG